MKRTIALIVAMLALCCLGAQADTLTLPSSLRIVGEEAFAGDTTIDKVVLPEGVQEIGPRAFADSTLTEINLPSTITSIDDTAFDNPEEVTIIAEEGTYAYEWASEQGYIGGEEWTPSPLEDFIIENGMVEKYVGPGGDVVIPKADRDGNRITSIRGYAFDNCKSLTTINIPAGVTSIGYRAFNYCISLTTINIPAGVTSIGDDAFRFCISLTTINIPASVTSIGNDAFSNCKSLTTINIPAGVTSIGDDAFHCCDSLTTINIPAGVTSIGEGAFCSCISLTNINIPASVTSIGKNAFNNCISLTTINIPAGVTSIEDYAFFCCESLTTINIPAGVTSIEDNAFGSCRSLTTINIPANVTSIGYGAFEYCISLTTINIPASVTSIEGYAFTRCKSLTTINIPAGVTSIGNGWFNACESLTTINIPAGVTSIGESAFCSCISLTNINIPTSVTSIGDKAFEDCRSLTNINIPTSVTSIGERVFGSCISLTTINIPAGVTSIGYRAFENCISLTTINIPASVTSIHGFAFDRCNNLTIYGIAGSYAETYAKWDGIPFSTDPMPVIEPEQTVYNLTGAVNTSNGVGIPDIWVYLYAGSSEDATLLGSARTDDSGVWRMEGIDAVNGAYLYFYSSEYTFSRNGISVDIHSDVTLDPVTAVLGSDEDIDMAVSFTMSASEVRTGDVVTFTVSAPGASLVRLVVDGVGYEYYELTDGEATISRAFSDSGSRAVQFQPHSLNGDGKISAAQTLTVTAAEPLEKAAIKPVDTQIVWHGFDVEWYAVEHASSYTVYLYHNDVQLWPGWNDVSEARTTGLSMSIPGDCLFEEGDYYVNVVAVGNNYDSSTSGTAFSVRRTDQAVEIVECPDTVAIGTQVSATVACADKHMFPQLKVVAPNGSSVSVRANGSSFSFAAAIPGTYQLTPYASGNEDTAFESAEAVGQTVNVAVSNPEVTVCYDRWENDYAVAFTDNTTMVACQTNCEGTVKVYIDNSYVGDATRTLNDKGQVEYRYDQLGNLSDGYYDVHFSVVYNGYESADTEAAHIPFYSITLLSEAGLPRYTSDNVPCFLRPNGLVKDFIPYGSRVTLYGVCMGYNAYIRYGNTYCFVNTDTLVETISADETSVTDVQYSHDSVVFVNDTVSVVLTVEKEINAVSCSVDYIDPKGETLVKQCQSLSANQALHF